MLRVECGVGSVVCGVWNVECGVWSVECGVWSLECGVWSVECSIFSLSVSVSVELQWNPLFTISDFKVEFPALSLGWKPKQAPLSG